MATPAPGQTSMQTVAQDNSQLQSDVATLREQRLRQLEAEKAALWAEAGELRKALGTTAEAKSESTIAINQLQTANNALKDEVRRLRGELEAKTFVALQKDLLEREKIASLALEKSSLEGELRLLKGEANDLGSTPSAAPGDLEDLSTLRKSVAAAREDLARKLASRIDLKQDFDARTRKATAQAEKVALDAEMEKLRTQLAAVAIPEPVSDSTDKAASDQMTALRAQVEQARAEIARREGDWIAAARPDQRAVARRIASGMEKIALETELSKLEAQLKAPPPTEATPHSVEPDNVETGVQALRDRVERCREELARRDGLAISRSRPDVEAIARAVKLGTVKISLESELSALELMLSSPPEVTRAPVINTALIEVEIESMKEKVEKSRRELAKRDGELLVGSRSDVNQENRRVQLEKRRIMLDTELSKLQLALVNTARPPEEDHAALQELETTVHSLSERVVKARSELAARDGGILAAARPDIVVATKRTRLEEQRVALQTELDLLQKQAMTPIVLDADRKWEDDDRLRSEVAQLRERVQTARAELAERFGKSLVATREEADVCRQEVMLEREQKSLQAELADLLELLKKTTDVAVHRAAEVDVLRLQNQSLSSEVEERRGELDNARVSIQRASDQCATLQAQRLTKENELLVLRTELAQLQREKQHLDSTCESLRQSLTTMTEEHQRRRLDITDMAESSRLLDALLPTLREQQTQAREQLLAAGEELYRLNLVHDNVKADADNSQRTLVRLNNERVRMSDLLAAIGQEISQVEQRISDNSVAMNTSQEHINNAERDLNTRQEERLRLNSLLLAQRKDLQVSSESILNLKTSMTALEVEADGTHKALERVELQLKKNVSEERSLEQEVARYTQDLHRAKNDLHDLTAELGTSHERLQRMMSAHADLRTQIHREEESIANGRALKLRRESEMDALQKQIDRLIIARKATEAELGTLNTELGVIQQRIWQSDSELRVIQENHDLLNSQTTTTKDQIEGMRAKVSECQRLIDDATLSRSRVEYELSNSLKALQRLSTEQMRYTNELSMRQTELQAATARLKECEDERKMAFDTAENVRKAVDDASRQTALARDRLYAHEKLIEDTNDRVRSDRIKLAETKAECETLEQTGVTLAESRASQEAVHRRYEHELTSIEARLLRYQAEKARLETEESTLTRELQELGTKLAQVKGHEASATAEVLQLRDSVVRLRFECASVRQECANVARQREAWDMRDVAEKQSLDSERLQLATELESLRQQLVVDQNRHRLSEGSEGAPLDPNASIRAAVVEARSQVEVMKRSRDVGSPNGRSAESERMLLNAELEELRKQATEYKRSSLRNAGPTLDQLRQQVALARDELAELLSLELEASAAARGRDPEKEQRARLVAERDELRQSIIDVTNEHRASGTKSTGRGSDGTLRDPPREEYRPVAVTSSPSGWRSTYAHSVSPGEGRIYTVGRYDRKDLTPERN